MIVVDASVAVKWLVFESGSNEALAILRDGEQPGAPGLIRVEVASALVRKVRIGEIERVDGEAALRRWLLLLKEGSLVLSPDELDLPVAIDLALALDHPVADCIYLALAQREGALFVSADRRFLRKAAQIYDRTHSLEVTRD